MTERKRTGLRDGDRWVTTVSVLDQEQYSSGQFNFGASYEDGSLNAVIQSLLEIRDSIPPEYQSTARCEISTTSSYGDYYANISVEYARPATAEEIELVSAQRAQQEELERARELALLNVLRQKYGG